MSSKHSLSDTPPSSPEVRPNKPSKELEMALKVIMGFLAHKNMKVDACLATSSPESHPKTPPEPLIERVRASKLAYEHITET
jgi:hypothetical protein